MAERVRLSQVRQQINRSRGLEKRKQSLKPKKIAFELKDGYNKQMMLTELQLGRDISVILFANSNSQAAEILGIDKSTASRWRAGIQRVYDLAAEEIRKEKNNESRTTASVPCLLAMPTESAKY